MRSAKSWKPSAPPPWARPAVLKALRPPPSPWFSPMSKAVRKPGRKPGVPEVFGPQEFAAATGVSRETLARLERYADLLKDWNSRHNLVSERSLEDLWRRHFWDCAQLVPLVPPETHSIADLGSGAGFPGLVLAELLRNQVSVTLNEATTKKCAFLAAASQAMELKVHIQNRRMEDAPVQTFDLVTA